MTNARQALGRRGETLARESIERAGWTVVAANMRRPGGEVDLVAKDGDCLVFIEVKLRRGRRYGLPEEALTPAKQRALRTVAETYLSELETSPHDWRIDVIAIELSPDGRLVRLDHHKNAVEG